MSKEQLIDRHAQTLKSYVGTGLAKDECIGLIKNAVDEALFLYGVGNRLSPVESTNVLRKPKLVQISTDLKNILSKKYDSDYDGIEDVKFIEKYTGKKVIVYEWCGDWWIAEDDNYPITEKCFEDLPNGY